MFLCGKVFNTSVDNFVEIRPEAQGNFRLFNVLALIAPFVGNNRVSYAVEGQRSRIACLQVFQN
ncbi:MAG: hypothetical protein DMG37_13385 [Acidobacteria bacterium]|nr:MAG: hypothetical protein DMG37_13385 [Acidobacteriota bacterium]